MKKIYFRNHYCLYIEAELFNGAESSTGIVKEKYITESVIICNHLKWDIIIKNADGSIIFISNVNIDKINDNSFYIEFKRENWEYDIKNEFQKTYIRKQKIQSILKNGN